MNLSPPQPPDFKLSEWVQRIARWLSRSDYTEAELRTRLEHAGLEPSHQSVVLERAQSLGWIADDRVATSTVARKSTRWGKRRVVQHLKERGVDQELIQEATAQINEDTELSTAMALWQRKFRGELPQTPQEKQKQIRFLVTRGFDMSVIRKIFDQAKN